MLLHVIFVKMSLFIVIKIFLKIQWFGTESIRASRTCVDLREIAKGLAAEDAHNHISVRLDS